MSVAVVASTVGGRGLPGYAWPGVFLTAELVGSWRQRHFSRARLEMGPPHRLTIGARLSIAAGAAMLFLAILPPSANLAAPVGFGFIMYIAVRFWTWTGSRRPIAL